MRRFQNPAFLLPPRHKIPGFSSVQFHNRKHQVCNKQPPGKTSPHRCQYPILLHLVLSPKSWQLFGPHSKESSACGLIAEQAQGKVGQIVDQNRTIYLYQFFFQGEAYVKVCFLTKIILPVCQGNSFDIHLALASFLFHRVVPE